MKKKKLLLSLMVVALATGFSSCALLGTGMVYEGVTEPLTATSNPLGNGTKVGTSNTVSVLGIVSIGNGGINAAAKNAGITKISVVDVNKTSVLGLFTKHETVVYGE